MEYIPQVVTSPLLVVTRVHMQVSSSKPDVDKMVKFVLNSSPYASLVLICVDSSNPLMLEYLTDLKNTLLSLNLSAKVDYLLISPWGYFTFPLNCALQYAQDHLFSNIAFQSVEYTISKDKVNTIVNMLSSDANLLVAGPEMNGHEFIDSTELVPLRGRTCPWNTFAVWSVSKLAVTGFPMIGDGVADQRNIGGVEEVSAINILQWINPTRHSAVLIRFVEPSHTLNADWNTSFTSDSARQAYHDKKMSSKDERPAAQMTISGIPSGVVRHVVINL